MVNIIEDKDRIKVLYLTNDGLSDQLGRSQIIPYLMSLSKYVNITICSVEKGKHLEQNIHSINTLFENKIEWSYSIYKSSVPFISQLINHRNLSKNAKWQFKKKNHSIIHCRSYLPSIIGMKLKRKGKSKLIFDMRGFWADERVDGNIWKKVNPIGIILYNYFKLKEIELLKKSDHIVSLTNAAKKYLINKYDYLKDEKISVIPCAVDLDFFDSNKLNNQTLIQISEKLGLKNGDFLISYIGSLGTWYMLEEMLHFFKILKESNKNAKFLIITHDNPKIVFDLCKNILTDSSSVKVTSATREEMPYYIKLCNYCIYFILPLFSKKASSPTKLGEIMAMGKPIVTNSGIGDVNEVYNEGNIGVLLNSFSQHEFKQAISSIKSNMEESSNEIRSVAESKFSLTSAVKKYHQIYLSLT